ncbi:hypothetical protein [Streptomyces iakyrus]
MRRGEVRAAAVVVRLRSPRGDKGEPSMTRGRIVQAAVALLDDEGMDKHPWAATLSARQRPLMGPNFLAWL